MLGAPWGFGLLGYTLAAGVIAHEACGTVYASIYTRTVHTLFLRTVCCGRVHRELPRNCCMSADGTLAVASRLGQRTDPTRSCVNQSFPRACALGVRLASHTPVVLRAMHMSPKPQAHCHAVARAEPAERVRGGRWMRTTYPVASVSGLPLRVWRNIHVAEHTCMRDRGRPHGLCLANACPAPSV